MAIIRQGNPNRICVHHSAVAPGADNLTDLRRRLASHETTHSSKSWASTTKTRGEHGYFYLAYHFAIAKDGHEIRTQDDKYVLYHAGDNFRGKESFNLWGIGVLIDGNYETEIPTPHQREALARIIARFERQYRVKPLARGHRQTAKSPTACPGRNLGDHASGFIKEAIDRANQILARGETDQPLNIPTPPPQPDLGREVERPRGEVKRLVAEAKGLAESLAEKEALIGEVRAEASKWQSEARSATQNLGKLLEENGIVRKDLTSTERKVEKLTASLAETEKEKNQNWQLYKKALDEQADKLSTLALIKMIFLRLYYIINKTPIK